MTAPEVPFAVRIQGLEKLDREAPYACAVARGLHGCLARLLADEARTSAERWRAGDRMGELSYLNFINCTLFRGQRGQRVDGSEMNSFSKVGHRIFLFFYFFGLEGVGTQLTLCCG